MILRVGGFPFLRGHLLRATLTLAPQKPPLLLAAGHATV